MSIYQLLHLRYSVQCQVRSFWSAFREAWTALQHEGRLVSMNTYRQVQALIACCWACLFWHGLHLNRKGAQLV